MSEAETTAVPSQEDPLASLDATLKPYRNTHTTYTRLPDEGRSREDILNEMKEFAEHETERWSKGYASGAVYHGDREHIDFLSDVYKLHSQSNPLHVDLWPSAIKFESEIVAMTGSMFSSDKTDDEIVGTVSSGGSESIMLAMKSYRDKAEAERGVTAPNMVVPITAHAAFDKASQYFKIEQRKIPFGDDYKADVEAAKELIDDNTVVIAGSAPSFPHGVIDPIEQLSELARERGIGFHTDACLGGFVLPWAERLGYDVPPFDFRLPGVTSISADTHKFGYAAKGTSVILYRGPELRHYQYFTTTDWPGGLYSSPSFAGSRPGALSATCWAAMLSMGEQGYLDATKKILEAAATIREGIDAIPELEVMGDPLYNIAFKSDDLDIYRVLDAMSERGWSLNGLHKPSCVHICVTLRQAQPGVAERFVSDLKESVAEVRDQPPGEGGFAPIYGLAASIPDRSMVDTLLKTYMDLWYRT
jgi:sphinganine-1-phosphate aldolase